MSTKRYTSTGQKALAFGLASATCLGVVGLISVRNAQDSAAATDEYTLTASTTSTGVTQAQLDQYASQLAAEQQRLEAYRLQLIDTANSLSAQPRTGTRVAPQIKIPKNPATSNSTSGNSNRTSAQEVAPNVPAPQVQAPPSRKYVPAPQQQSSSNNSGAANAPAAQSTTKASKG